MLSSVIAEDIVIVESDGREVLRRSVVGVEGEHGVAGILGQGHLRGGDSVLGIGDGVAVRVDLEVDVGPPAGVAAGEDRGEGDFTGGIGDLDTAQPGRVLDSVGVHRVAALSVTVPGVDGDAFERGIVTGHIGDLEGEGQGHTVDGVGAVDVRPDVRAHDSGLFEDVRAVRAVCRIRSGRLVGDLGDRSAAARGRIRRAGGCGGARGQGHGADTGADESEDSAAAEEGADVERGALIDDLLVGTVEEPSFVGGSVRGLVGFGYASHELSFLR